MSPSSLGQDADALPPAARDAIIKARTRWLKNAEVCDLLQNYQCYGLPVAREAPDTPAGGSLFLFDRKLVRFFRRDGHHWRKKADGKTVRETHEKLKIGAVDTLNCYYAHSEAGCERLHRRCYWLLEGDSEIVLVHYLCVGGAGGGGGARPAQAAASPLSAATAASPCRRKPSAAPQMARAGSLPAALPSGATVTTGVGLWGGAAADALLPSQPSHSSSSTAAHARFPARCALQPSRPARPVLPPSPFGGDDRLSGTSVSLPLGLMPDRQRALGSLHSAPVPTAPLGGGTSAFHAGWPPPPQDSRQSSQSIFSELVLPGELLGPLPRSSVGGGLLPRQASRGPCSPPAAADAEPFALQRVGSEVAETHDLCRADSGSHQQMTPGTSTPRGVRAPGANRDRGRGRQAESAAPAGARLKKSIVSPFETVALTGDPIGKQQAAEEPAAPRWHSTSALAMRPAFSQDRVASATASDFGRMDLERRCSKRQKSGLTSQRPSHPSNPSSDSLFAAIMDGSLFGELPAAGSGLPTPPGPLPQLGLHAALPDPWQVPPAQPGWEVDALAWSGESFPQAPLLPLLGGEQPPARLLPEAPPAGLLPKPSLLHMLPEPPPGHPAAGQLLPEPLLGQPVQPPLLSEAQLRALNLQQQQQQAGLLPLHFFDAGL